jgi:TolB-like protein
MALISSEAFMSRLLAFVLCLLFAPALARANVAGKPIVAVLYFDNNTGDPSFDVLQKGFADMMVTDLSAVQQLQVVEREKLQKLLEELELQKSGYFDPKTALRIGQGIGAQFAVTGSFQALDPTLRIDVRLIEIATSKVLVAEQVSGEKNRLFDLQQQLVGRFVAGLALKLDKAPKLRSRAPDVATLVSYSKGLDLADQGKLQEASVQLASVVSKAPTFLLARERHEQFLERLKASEERRIETLEDLHEVLGQKAERFLQDQKLASLQQPEASTFLAWRLIRMRYLARTLRKHLASKSPHLILPGHEKEALQVMKLWRTQAQAYVRESAEYFQRFSQVIDGTPYIGSSDLKLPPEDAERVRQAKYGALRFDETPAIEVARALLLGRFEDGSESYNMGPSLSDLEPSALEEGLRLLDEAAQAAEPLPPRLRETRMKQALELHGDALMRKGRTEEAIAKWQRFLDLFPTSGQFKFVSEKIKTALGMGSNAYSNAGATFSQSLADCDKSGILQGYDQELHRRLLTRGYTAARELFREVDSKCGEDQQLKPYLRSLLTSSALSAAQAGDCDSFHTLMARFLALNGSQGDVAGYLKNHVPHCQRAESLTP